MYCFYNTTCCPIWEKQTPSVYENVFYHSNYGLVSGYRGYRGTLEEQAVMRRLHEKLSGGSGTPGDSPQIRFQIGSGISHQDSMMAAPPQGVSSEYYYQLSLDEEFNVTVREEFYYDHVSGCLDL